MKDDLLQEVEQLKAFINSDLEVLRGHSKIKCPSTQTVSRLTDKKSIYFVPQNDDDRDSFIELFRKRANPTANVSDGRVGRAACTFTGRAYYGREIKTAFREIAALRCT